MSFCNVVRFTIVLWFSLWLKNSNNMTASNFVWISAKINYWDSQICFVRWKLFWWHVCFKVNQDKQSGQLIMCKTLENWWGREGICELIHAEWSIQSFTWLELVIKRLSQKTWTGITLQSLRRRYLHCFWHMKKTLVSQCTFSRQILGCQL